MHKTFLSAVVSCETEPDSKAQMDLRSHSLKMEKNVKVCKVRKRETDYGVDKELEQGLGRKEKLFYNFDAHFFQYCVKQSVALL